LIPLECRYGAMPTSVRVPVLHPGPLHTGPAVAFALRGPRDRLGSGQRRPVWDGRHQVTWNNDNQNPNMRSYFDRYVDRGGEGTFPRLCLRPTWKIDEPDEREEGGAYQIFDAANAVFKEQRQWISKPSNVLPADPPSESQQRSLSLPTTSVAASSTAHQRTHQSPCWAVDLKAQRARESDWNRHHSVVYSRLNQGFQPNVRSYFDRWKDDEGGQHERSPSWRLPPEKRSPLDRTRSEPVLARSVLGQTLPGRPDWVDR